MAHPSRSKEHELPEMKRTVFRAKTGEQIYFAKEGGQWRATVTERIGACSLQEVLPVFCERHGDIATALGSLRAKQIPRLKSLIHVMRRPRSAGVQRFVYIGEEFLSEIVVSVHS